MSDRLAAARAYVEKKPTDRFGLYALAMELRKVRDWESCFSTFEALLLHHPNYGAGFYHFGMAKKESGDVDATRQVWEAGIAACAKSDPHAVAEITEALEALGED